MLVVDGSREMSNCCWRPDKKLDPRLFRVTCMAHLLHNCAMRVRANYAVVELVARVKAVGIKNRLIRAFLISFANLHSQL